MSSPDKFALDIEAIGRIASVPHILEMVCRTTGMGFSAVARVTEDRWIACAVRDEIAFGLTPGGELKLETTICHEIRQSGEGVVIDHVAQSPAFRDHHTPKMYGFQSYISLPIKLSDGRFFGTLCAIDPRPARLDTPETVGMFKLFAELIAAQIEAQERVRLNEESLADEHRTARLREEFIAVLGHDLRNPLAAFEAGLRQLRKSPLDDRAQMIAGLMQDSVARMSALIQDVLDLARGRLGDGLTVHRATVEPQTIVAQIVAEARAKWPGRGIETEFAFDGTLMCDGGRLGQVVSNLLENALTHGARDGTVWVRCTGDAQAFEMSVHNQGAPIAADTMERLFQPFERGAGNAQGLGLGLYISAEIARAHGGSLSAASDQGETRFTLRLPR